MRIEPKHIVSLVFIIVGFILTIIYSVAMGVYYDECEGMVFDGLTIFDSVLRMFYPVLGIGLVIFFLPSRK